MGFPKALLPLGSGIFLTRILDELEEAGLTDPLVVLGKDARHIEPCIAGWPVRILINRDPSRGQLSSIQLAIQSLGSEVDGCLIWPVDQPAISADVVKGLIDLFHKSGALIACPSFGEKRGHPVIFHRSLFWELLHCSMETGAKSAVMRHQGETVVLPTAESATVTDIDTPEDYFNLTGEILDAGQKTGGRAKDSEPGIARGNGGSKPDPTFD